MKNCFNSFNIFIGFQIDELNGTLQTYRTTISEKDAKLSELQSKLENASVDQREQELFKQIAEYKEKNNVSSYTLPLAIFNNIFCIFYIGLDRFEHVQRQADAKQTNGQKDILLWLLSKKINHFDAMCLSVCRFVFGLRPFVHVANKTASNCIMCDFERFHFHDLFIFTPNPLPVWCKQNSNVNVFTMKML